MINLDFACRIHYRIGKGQVTTLGVIFKKRMPTAIFPNVSFSVINSLNTTFGVHSFSYVESEISQELTFKANGDLIPHFRERE